ncbi:MAG: PDZ domain-containing protein, partial [Proteobacteria bacterium]|nr:PDZ domain-containing protein [Pseudomonadota bacterium]
LVKYGKVKRGVLGVNIYDVTPDVAKEFGLNESRGALVASVIPGSAADKAGVRTGDIIISINGTNTKGAGEVRATIGLLRVGDRVDIGLLRDGKPLRVTAIIGERSDAEADDATAVNRALEGADLADAGNEGGVVVRSVQDGSPAAQAGLRSNDIIMAVGRTRVANLKQFREAMKGAKVAFLNIRRGNATLLVPIR